jgi:hypothetical protein
MLWVTSRIIHFDRVASAWLISRFIDPDATFDFIEPGSPFPPDSTTFSVVGGDIGRHDHEGTTFTKLVKRYELKDAALGELEKIVAAGVAYVMQGSTPGADDRPAWVAVGLLAAAEGMLILEDSDADILRRSLPIWDAVYADAGVRLLRKAPPGAASDNDALLGTRYGMALARIRQAVGPARARGRRAD